MKTFALSLVLLFSLAIIAPSIAQDAAAQLQKKSVVKRQMKKLVAQKRKRHAKKSVQTKKIVRKSATKKLKRLAARKTQQLQSNLQFPILMQKGSLWAPFLFWHYFT